MLHFAVHSGSWKLVRQTTAKSENNMLFRIAEDPNEAKDLSAENPRVVRDLIAKLETWRSVHPANGLRHSDAAPAGWKAPKAWADDAAR